MKFTDTKYLLAYTVPLATYISLTQGGWWSFFSLFYAFVLIPILELFLTGTSENLSPEEEEIKKKSKFFDVLLWLNVPLQYALLFLFLNHISDGNFGKIEILGMCLSMGISCGILGINVAHELGHRNHRFEQFLSKSLLLTSLYMHFFIEHNRGHHKNVATPLDPASAKSGESLYHFWWRSVKNSFLSAWNLEIKRLEKDKISKWSLQNEMLQFILIEIVFVVAIGLYWNFFTMICFVVAAIIGFLLLETVNYIEHYGLSRKEIEPGVYERVQPHHSWNSNHTLGRILLYELTRHSDHHYLASRKYEILRHFDHSPQFPTGYPGMMILSFIPPLWFHIMDKKIEKKENI